MNNIFKTLEHSAAFFSLGRQSLPLRGSWDQAKKAEGNSNFVNLLKLRSEDDYALKDWMKRNVDKYTSPVIQNELIEVINYVNFFSTYINFIAT